MSTCSSEIVPITEEIDSVSSDFIFPGTIVDVRPDQASNDKFYLIEVTESNCVAADDIVDDNGIRIPINAEFLKGFPLENVPPYTNKTHYIYEQSKKSTYFYKESVLYPYMQMEFRKIKILLSKEEFVTIDNIIIANGLCHI